MKNNFMQRAAKKPVIVAIVGLVGSGKGSVARALAKTINAKNEKRVVFS